MCGHSLLMNGHTHEARALLELAAQTPGESEFKNRAVALLELMATNR